jgi:quercetin dioxygenase-like cupin family protein
MYGYTIASPRIEEMDWMPLDFPGVGVKVLHQDEAPGAMIVLTRLEPGAAIPEHWHSQADETVYVLEGEFIENASCHGPGSLFVARAGSLHGPHRSETGCTVLTQFTAGLDFNPVE